MTDLPAVLIDPTAAIALATPTDSTPAQPAGQTDAPALTHPEASASGSLAWLSSTGSQDLPPTNRQAAVPDPGSAIALPEQILGVPDQAISIPASGSKTSELHSTSRGGETLDKAEGLMLKAEGGTSPDKLSAPLSQADSEFTSLPETARADLRVWQGAIEAITRAGDGRLQAPGIDLCKAVARRMQVHWQAVYRHAKKYVASGGNWQSLVNRKLAGDDWWDGEKITLPPEFLEYWKSLCEATQRSSAAAWRELIRIWKTHHHTRGGEVASIPGYPVWPEADPRTNLPRGWSKGRLAKLTPLAVELAAARLGRSAARDSITKVHTTRCGLKPGQIIIFDDQWYDLKINFPGNNRALRPLGLNALDLFSASHIQTGFRPRAWNDETAQHEGIRKEEMIWFVVNLLTTIGYRIDAAGTTFHVEHGTAAIDPDFESRIASVTGGLVRVARGGIGGQATFDGLFEGQPRGNFRFKAALESSFNLVRGEMALLPGAVGKDRNNCPADIYGRDKYNERLLKIIPLLTEQEASLLLFPYLSWSEFVSLAMRIYQRINDRTWHDLEGWEKAGLIRKEWRLTTTDDHWQTDAQFLTIPAPLQQQIGDLLRQDSRLVRIRKASPAEVWATARPELRKVPPSLWPELCGPALAIKRAVRQGYISFQDRELDSDTLRYRALVDGCELEGAYQTFTNPFDPHWMAVCNDRFSLIGVIERQTAPCRLDEDAIHELMGAQKKEEARVMHAVGIRGLDRSREMLAMRANNNAVLARHSQAAPAPVCTRGIHSYDFESLPEAAPEPSRPRAQISDQEQAMEELGKG